MDETTKTFHSPNPIWPDDIWALIQLETAKSFAVHKGCAAEIEKLYAKDKFRFYELSKQHPMYNFKLCLSMKLDWQLVCRHALGILWAADEDADLRGKIQRLIKRTAPSVYDYAVLPNRKNSETYFRERARYLDSVMFTGFTDGFIAYLRTWVYASVDEIPSQIKQNYQLTLEYSDKILNQNEEMEEKFANHAEPTPSEKMLQEYCNSWAHIDFIVRSSRNEPYPESEVWPLIRLVRSDLGSCTRIVSGFGIVDRLFEIAGLTWENMLDPSPLDERTHRLLVDLAYSFDETLKKKFDPKQYAYSIAMYRLIEEYGRAKSTYFVENEENLALELRKRDEQIKSLNAHVDALTQQNQRLLLENEQLKKAAALRSKEDNSLVRKATQPLQKQINAMQKQLRQVQILNYDCAEMREFIFNLDNAVLPEEAPTDFNVLRAKYRIATLGGHDILRTKLKEKYPDFKVLDGTLKSLDFSALLKTVDVLFIFTGHMSHAVYEKAIAAVCQRQTQFYYLNATNLDVITMQMTHYLLHAPQP